MNRRCSRTAADFERRQHLRRELVRFGFGLAVLVLMSCILAWQSGWLTL